MTRRTRRTRRRKKKKKENKQRRTWEQNKEKKKDPKRPIYDDYRGSYFNTYAVDYVKAKPLVWNRRTSSNRDEHRTDGRTNADRRRRLAVVAT